jgi:5-formyltetrahydrofolate cyclo-ligase
LIRDAVVAYPVKYPCGARDELLKSEPIKSTGEAFLRLHEQALDSFQKEAYDAGQDSHLACQGSVEAAHTAFAGASFSGSGDAPLSQSIAEKRAVRHEMEIRRRALDAATLASRSVEACRHLRSLPEWDLAGTVALYAALGGEVDPAVVLPAATGKRLVFPRMEGTRRILTFHAASGLDALVPGRHGVLEPIPDADTAVPLGAIDLFVVPAVAFDTAGRRLGRGQGYYDATLSAARPEAVRVGLAFDWQVVAALAADPWDEGMDVVVTDEKVLRTGRRSDTRMA